VKRTFSIIGRFFAGLRVSEPNEAKRKYLRDLNEVGTIGGRYLEGWNLTADHSDLPSGASQVTSQESISLLK
jgi:hypothetical protein